MIALIVSSMIFSISHTQPYYDSVQGYTKYKSLPSMMLIITKFASFIGYKFLSSSVLGSVSVIVCIGFGLSQIAKMQYYHKTEMETLNTFLFIFILLKSIEEIVKDLLNLHIHSMLLVPIVLCSVIGCKLIISFRERKIAKEFKEFLLCPTKDGTNIMKLMLFLQSASSRYLISREYLIKYLGICQIYSAYSKQSQNTLTDSLKVLAYNRNKMSNVSQLHYSFVVAINNIFNDVLKENTKKNGKMLLAYASFLVWSQINTLQSFLVIKVIEEKDLSFEESFHLLVIKEHNKKLFAANFDDSQNYSRVIIFENRWKSFKLLISKVSEQFENLWYILLGNNPDLKLILKTVSQINDMVEDIEHLWENISSHEVSSNKAIMLYSRFERWLMNDFERAFNLLEVMQNIVTRKSALQIIKENSKYKIASKLKKQGVAFLCVSTLINQSGIITSCNLATCRMIGVAKSKLVGNHMSVVMPTIYHEQHIACIQNNSSKAKIDHHLEINGFLKHSSGYLQRIKKAFADVPTLINGSEYIVAFELYNVNSKSNTPTGAILTNPQYKIEGITSEIIELLKVNKLVVSTNKDISEVVFDYEKTIKIQSHRGITYNSEPVIMNSLTVGYWITVSKNEEPVLEECRKGKQRMPFEFAFCKELNKYVRQFKSNIDNDIEDTVSVKISPIARGESLLLSETEKKTFTSNLDESFILMAKTLEESNSKYFTELLNFVKIVSKMNPVLLADIHERLVYSLHRKK